MPNLAQPTAPLTANRKRFKIAQELENGCAAGRLRQCSGPRAPRTIGDTIVESIDTGGISSDPGLDQLTGVPDANTSAPDQGDQAFVDAQTGTTFTLDPSTGLPVALDPAQAGDQPLTDSAVLDPSQVSSNALDPQTGNVDPFGALGSISGLDSAPTASEPIPEQPAPDAGPVGGNDGIGDSSALTDMPAASADSGVGQDATTSDGSDLSSGVDLGSGASGEDTAPEPTPEPETQMPEPPPPETE